MSGTGPAAPQPMAAETPPPERPCPFGLVPLLATTLTATLALYAMAWALPRLGCALLLPLLAAAAWPLWAYRREQMLFGRRLVLAAVSTDAGRLRRWFWHGTLMLSIGVPAALIWAAVMLLMATQLQSAQWLILAADALLLALLAPALQHVLRGEIVPAYLGVVARRWPVLLANSALLVLAFAAHDYWVGFEDTRELGWNVLVARALSSATAQCETVAALIGAAALADQLPRHAAMLLLPTLPDAQARVAAWAVFLGLTGFGGYLFTRFLLGAMATLDSLRGASRPRAGRLYVAVAALALAALAWAAAQGWGIAPATLGQLTQRLALATNACARHPGQAQALRADLQRQIDAAQQQAITAAMVQVDQGLDAAFGAAQSGIDGCLDWYFSLVGSCTRLGAVIVPGLADKMRVQFTTQVFDVSGFDTHVTRLGEAANALLLDRMADHAATLGRHITARLGTQPCLRDRVRPALLPDLSRDKLRLGLSAAIALPLSRVLLPLSVRATEAVLARAAARQTVKAAASAAGATAGKRGASVLLSAGAASAICAPGGPLALACGAIAGVVTWIGVDMALVAIDEALFREAMKAELVEELQAQRKLLREAMRAQLELAASAYGAHAANAVDKLFVPAAQD